MRHFWKKIALSALVLVWTIPFDAVDHAKKLNRSPQHTNATFVGIASWYGHRHQGRRMANGQSFDAMRLTAASRSVPLGCRIRVFNLENGRFVDVTVTDRGPSSKVGNRILDVSKAAATQLGFVGAGTARVFFTPLPKTRDADVDSLLELHPTQSATY